MLLHQAFEGTARRLPDKTALVAGNERVRFGDLLRQAQAMAQMLRSDGVAPGDRVIVQFENSVAFVIAVHAVLMAGAVIVPVSPLVKSQKLAFLASDTRASALLCHASLAAAWLPLLQGPSTLITCRVVGDLTSLGDDPRVRGWLEPLASADAAPTHRQSDDLAVLIYTSGTTGLPKGVMMSHHNIVSAWTAIQAYLALREDDVVAMALPCAFSYGFNTLMMSLAVGATVVLDRGAAFPVKVANTLVNEGVTVFPGVPTLFASLLGLESLGRFDFSAMRLITNAAADLPTPHLHRLRTVFPKAKLVAMYGMTECVRASYLTPEEVDERPGSVGKGMANQDHWLVSDQGQRLPPNSQGELVVSGPHVMQGYWDRPEETAAKLTNNPKTGLRELRTGDVFRSDADGYLYFVARKDDIIKTRGEKVAPREVENAIYQLDAVTGCAVVGVSDETLGQAIKAYVTLRPECTMTERDIIKHCLSTLESYMAPKHVEIVAALPRTDSGKVRHASLR